MASLEKTKDSKNLTLFHLTWPIFIETALFMLLGFVDVFVLSKYDDVAASAVNTANQAVSICTLVFTIISGAGAVLISQNLGAGNKENASRIAALAITFNMIMGIGISILFLFCNRSIMEFIGAKDKVLEFGCQYLQIVGGFMFLQALMDALVVIIRNHGLTQISMYVTVVMNVVNTALDVIFVLGLFGMPRMGIAGVAIATSFSRLLGTAVLIVILFKKVEKLSIFKLLVPFPIAEVKNMLKIGVPSAFESFNYNVSQLVVTSIVLTCLTTTELVTKTYVQNITMFFYIFSVSIGQASQILIGHLVGAGKYDDAYKSCLRSFRIALAITMSVSVVGILLRTQLIGLFTADPAVIAAGGTLLILNIFIELGRTSNLVVISSLRGAGDVFFPTGAAIFSMWLVSTLGSYLLAVVLGMGLNGLWVAFAADECLRGVLMLWRWHSGKWCSKTMAAVTAETPIEDIL